MKLSIFYRQNTEQERPVIEFKEMMRRRHPSVEVHDVDLDSREGVSVASLYGITRYPAILVTAIDGSMQGLWEGIPLPLIDEVFGSMLEQQGSSV